jgi:hypothetical protein
MKLAVSGLRSAGRPSRRAQLVTCVSYTFCSAVVILALTSCSKDGADSVGVGVGSGADPTTVATGPAEKYSYGAQNDAICHSLAAAKAGVAARSSGDVAAAAKDLKASTDLVAVGFNRSSLREGHALLGVLATRSDLPTVGSDDPDIVKASSALERLASKCPSDG